MTNETLLQFQADILDVPVIRANTKEISALGAAYMAGLAVGYWKDLKEIKKHWMVSDVYEAAMEKERVEYLKKYWNRAVSKSQNWIDSKE